MGLGRSTASGSGGFRVARQAAKAVAASQSEWILLRPRSDRRKTVAPKPGGEKTPLGKKNRRRWPSDAQPGSSPHRKRTPPLPLSDRSPKLVVSHFQPRHWS